ncbi:MAG: hypothetical protein KJ593_05160 [Candidatus Omnitrophica bacterium]|nr:hypothetical protein [Candidatus Omnitrophota bacterium]
MENYENAKQRNPADYLKILFRRKWLFITPIFAGLVISITLAFTLPPTYESSTVILVEEEKIINPLIQGLAVSTSVAQRMRTLREQILSWSSLVELAKKLDLAKNVKNQLEYENLIKSLRNNILVQMRGPNIIRLAYFGKEPEETQLIAKTITDVFIEKNVQSQSKETDVAIEFIKDQLRIYKRKIKETEIASLEDQLKKLLGDSTEQHPMVKDLRQKIQALNQELNSGGYEVGDIEKPVTNPVYEALKEEIDKVTGDSLSSIGATAYASNDAANEGESARDSIYKLLLMDKIDSVLARDIRVNENIYNMLLQKLETAKITQRLEVSKEGTRYTILDPPRLPLQPSKPKKILVIFLGLFFGGMAGTGLVLGREFMDKSFLDIEDAKSNLELPILGAISRLTTQEEIDKEKRKKKMIIIIGLVVSALLIIISMFMAFFRS